MNSIVVEGIPGTGKTTIAAMLSERLGLILHAEDVIAPDVFSLWRATQGDDERIFFIQWELKARVARLVNREAVWDRNHLSALAYNYAKASLAGDSRVFDATMRWYKNRIAQGRLSEPSRYLILDVPAEVSVQRKAQTIKDCAWASERGLELSRAFYAGMENFLAVPLDRAPSPEVIRVAADGPLSEVQTRVLAELG